MIRTENLTKRFGRTPVLQDLDLRIAPGERVALVGANGAGKTTLIRCLLGEYTFDGMVSVGGRPVRAGRTEVLREVGFVPQLPPPLKLPVSQLLRFAAELCGEDVGRMHDVARSLGLDVDRVRGASFAKLSGGQKQKLLIAVALGRDTRLLMMDEPAANLDPDARAAFFALLAERAPHTTMLISSHRIDEVASLVERVVELERGEIAFDDRVIGTGSLRTQLRCRVELAQPSDGVAAALGSWGFRKAEEGRLWEGSVPSPDRLRFFATLARYSASIERVEVDGRDA